MKSLESRTRSNTNNYIKRKNRIHGRYRNQLEIKLDLLRHIAEQDTQRDCFTRMLYIVPVYLRLKTVLEELVNSGVLQLQTSHNMRNRSGHERRNYVLTQQGRLLLDKIEKLNELCPLDRLL